MGVFDFLPWKKQAVEITALKKQLSQQPEKSALVYNNVWSVSYNGEKELGGIGPIIDYKLDHDSLRMRAWQSFLESEITQTIIKKFITWIIGSGLKLQAEPDSVVLKMDNKKAEAFSETVESRFRVYSNSKYVDVANQKNLAGIAEEAYKNAILGGDVLVILRYDSDNLKIQLVDGQHIRQPFESVSFTNATAKGNRIVNGIELSATGEHVAYYVCVSTGTLKTERILARGADSGRLLAYMVYGLRYRLDNHRGIPLVSTVLETVKKMDRYKDATVGSAEERQKIAYQIVHNEISTGENPLAKQLSAAFNGGDVPSDLPKDINGTELANTVATTTNKQTFNMPKGSELKSLESKNELYFKDFFTTNANLICASIGIPPEIAFSKYDSNFSASRAALKDWEHTINVNRKKFASQFYQPFYNLWLEIEIMKGNIQAPGYLSALVKKDIIILESYQSARFVGPGVPHIDPLKEVNAERLKLGTMAAHIPLTTVEASTELLNGGDSDVNMQQFSEEIKFSEGLGITPVVKQQPRV